MIKIKSFFEIFEISKSSSSLNFWPRRSLDPFLDFWYSSLSDAHAKSPKNYFDSILINKFSPKFSKYGSITDTYFKTGSWSPPLIGVTLPNRAFWFICASRQSNIELSAKMSLKLIVFHKSIQLFLENFFRREGLRIELLTTETKISIFCHYVCLFRLWMI